eukprot:347423-Pyramimonas_sp.AAC.1
MNGYASNIPHCASFTFVAPPCVSKQGGAGVGAAEGAGVGADVGTAVGAAVGAVANSIAAARRERLH